MIAWLWLACSTTPAPPPELVLALSAYHDVPELEDLSRRVPGLPGHLLTLAEDGASNPLVRTRAWMLFSRMSGAGPRARKAVGDPGLPPTVRTKVLRGLAEAHPAHAALASTDVWCDPSPYLRETARQVVRDLRETGREVRPPHCPTQ